MSARFGATDVVIGRQVAPLPAGAIGLRPGPVRARRRRWIRALDAAARHWLIA
ncbi:hypothetical protein ABH922_003143 [Rhodococcus sp. 27YEA15]|uniref:hypothetical protein n=1 Tax=Rhodococcus sp. 27YEA15 TaxID=3156259 RepID=UPI003C7DDC25